MNEKSKAELEKLAKSLDIKFEGNEYDKLTTLFEDAVLMIQDYTNREELNDVLYSYARKIAKIAFNMEGNEGETSRSEGGVSQSFLTDIPEEIKRSLNRYRRGKVIKYYAPKKS